MLIFVVPAIYPFKDNPQLGIYIQEQCEAIRKKYNYKMVVLNAATRNYKKWNICNTVVCEEDSVGTVYTKLTKGFMQSRFPRLAVMTYQKNLNYLFKRACKDFGKPDIIYAHFSFASGYCVSKLSKKYEVPFVVDEHYSLNLQENLNPYIAKITRKTIESSSAFICVSNRLKNSIYKHTGTKNNIHVIPNLVNDRYFYSPRTKKDKFIFFSAGNLYKSKNFALLIDAFAEAFFKDDNVLLLIGGDGPQRETLVSLIKKLNRENQIILLGRLSSEQMVGFYQQCDCFALLSEYETFGIVYREALAVGRPIISTKNGGIEENWHDEYGILLKDNTKKHAVDAFRNMYKNIDNYDFEKISNICKTYYSSDTVVKSIVEILEDVNYDTKNMIHNKG